MNRIHIVTTLAAAALMAGTTVSGVAYAGEWGHGSHRRYHDRDYRYGHHGRHYSKHHRSRRHGGRDAAFGVGLIFGSLLGYAISDHPRHRYYWRSQQPAVVYTPPPAVVYTPPAATYTSPPYCLQEREYQTTVIVGGKPVEAYGTACLQPDGSWTPGPAALVKQF